MIKDFLIINCTGKNDKIGLKVNNNFFIHNFQTKIKNNEISKKLPSLRYFIPDKSIHKLKKIKE